VLRWEIASAHRGAVTALYYDNHYIISGGVDGIMRLWTRQSHTLLTQFSDNRKQIVRIFPDLIQPHLIHSCGFDRSLNTYDLKLVSSTQERRVVRHEIGNGALCDMTQRKDNENELITCGVGSGILFWDCDEKNPVMQIPFSGNLNALQISPSGAYLAAGSTSSELFIFEVRTSRCLAQGQGHSLPINRLQWSPDEKQIVTVSEDCSVAIWNFYG
jgi:WD40 repeat protein